MFPFQQSCELSFQVPSDKDLKPDNTNTNINTNTSNNNFIKTPKSKLGRTRKFNSSNNLSISKNNDDSMKRTTHRDVERHRRQEMSNLYSSLRSLLPMEYIKGKRSISDHITEAAKYIKNLEKSVKELGDKRDMLKDSCSSRENMCYGEVGCSSSSITHSKSDCKVKIQKLISGLVQVEISVGVRDNEEVFPLSRVVEVLLEEGLDVVSCVSSKVNQRWIYVIQCQVNEAKSIDTDELERRLAII